jgi:predicted O-methyltransferase YrrM
MLLPGEWPHLLAIIALMDRPRTMLEIGCHEGKTAAIILKEFPLLLRYIGVDVLAEYATALPIQRGERPASPGRAALHDKRFELLLLRNGSFDLDARTLGDIDIVFIDGDHGINAVRHDTDLARSVVRNGIIIWHDYGNPMAQVTDVISADIRSGRVIKTIKNTWLAFEEIYG